MTDTDPRALSEPKRECENMKEKERVKSKSAECERKSANSSLPHWKPGSRAQSRSAGGKAKVLSKIYIQYGMLNILST
jgi:hypothetical protein